MRWPSTFESHVERLDSYRMALDSGWSPDDVVAAVRRLDSAVAEVDGRGFVPTPAAIEHDLARSLGLDSELWVKDETSNVSGSHKGRHLFGVALRRMVEQSSGDVLGERFAIASCGNAALAASVVARALDRPIDVFVPTWADADIVDRIESLGATAIRCERESGTVGDPCHRAMVSAVAEGSVAFSCQGTDTPSTLDGGRTLGWELVDSLIAHDGSEPTHLDRVILQVGGGALASSTVLALADEVGRGRLASLPVVHVVQPEGNHPFVVAWDLVVSEMLDGFDVAADRAAAATELGRIEGPMARAVLTKVAADQGRYMRPWPEEPQSYASGILDDITYDWLAILEATLATGGWPVVACEKQLREAHSMAHDKTRIDVSPTGAAGLGGLLALLADGSIPSTGERMALLFTGIMRPGDPIPEPR